MTDAHMGRGSFGEDWFGSIIHQHIIAGVSQTPHNPKTQSSVQLFISKELCFIEGVL